MDFYAHEILFSGIFLVSFFIEKKNEISNEKWHFFQQIQNEFDFVFAIQTFFLARISFIHFLAIFLTAESTIEYFREFIK